MAVGGGLVITIAICNILFTHDALNPHHRHTKTFNNDGLHQDGFHERGARGRESAPVEGGSRESEGVRGRPETGIWTGVIQEGASWTLTESKRLNFGEREEPNFLILNPGLCGSGELYALIFVQSAAHHFDYRKNIRRTWGGFQQVGELRLRTVFMLARPATPSLQTQIQEEHSLHADIVQMNFMDHYRNLTKKHILSLGWISGYCNRTRYIVKADDDTMVNIYRLTDFLHTRYEDCAITDHIYCSVFTNQGPRRSRQDKWYVGEDDYPQEKYPPYCEGFAYITGPHVAHLLHQAALTLPEFWIDDVFITGIVAHKIGLRHAQFRDPNGYQNVNSITCDASSVKNSIFKLYKYKLKRHDWFSCWDNITAFSSREALLTNKRISKH